MNNNHTANDFTPTPTQIRDAKISAALRGLEGRMQLSMAITHHIRVRRWIEGQVRFALPIKQIGDE